MFSLRFIKHTRRNDTTGSKCTDYNDDAQANGRDQVVAAPLEITVGDVHVSTCLRQKYEDVDELVAVTSRHATSCNDQNKLRQTTITLVNQESTHEQTRGASLELTRCNIGFMLKQTSTCTYSTKGFCFYLLEERDQPRIDRYACRLRTLVRDKTTNIFVDFFARFSRTRVRIIFLFLPRKEKGLPFDKPIMKIRDCLNLCDIGWGPPTQQLDVYAQVQKSPGQSFVRIILLEYKAYNLLVLFKYGVRSRFPFFVFREF